MSTTGGRPLRADAQRNRDRLLTSAVRMFSEHGPDVPLDAVAKDAGVGIGTLYRNFPTRENLIEAAYRNELTHVCEQANRLLTTKNPPAVALRMWMDQFIDYMTTKAGMGDALRAVIAAGGDPYSSSRARLGEAVTLLLRASTKAGSIRSDVDPDDILLSLSGIALAAGAPEQRAQADRMLDLLMDGLRYRDTP
ncbi:AcrR family transcriptional regulator [Rhodococcus sp. 27YEA15]|uniref:TetR/AcrR family transcriptional regulator n=1 Tax=Rhodococcus sp. 27YEA15 TaxID=3156259 RepID=UPI003C79A889